MCAYKARAFDAPQTGQETLRHQLDSLGMALESDTQMAPRGAQRGPEGSEMAPKGAFAGKICECLQHTGLRCAPDKPRGPKTTHKRPRDGPKMARRCLQHGPDKLWKTGHHGAQCFDPWRYPPMAPEAIVKPSLSHPGAISKPSWAKFDVEKAFEEPA